MLSLNVKRRDMKIVAKKHNNNNTEPRRIQNNSNCGLAEVKIFCLRSAYLFDIIFRFFCARNTKDSSCYVYICQFITIKVNNHFYVRCNVSKNTNKIETLKRNVLREKERIDLKYGNVKTEIIYSGYKLLTNQQIK